MKRASLAALLLIGACVFSSAPPSTPSKAPAGDPHTSPAAEPQHSSEGPDEIAALEASIARGMASLGLPTPHADPDEERITRPTEDSHIPTTGGGATAKPAAPRDRNGDGDACTSTCRVVEGICAAAEKICDIADRAPPTSDAPGRCVRARDNCAAARPKAGACQCR